MTLFGKLFAFFTVLATLGLIWLSAAVFHTHRSWKDVVKSESPTGGFGLGLESRLADAESLYAKVRAEKNRELETLAVERGAARERIADLESQIVQIDQRITQYENELATITATLRLNEQVLVKARDTLAVLRTEFVAARDHLRQMRRDYDHQIDQFVQVQKQINALQLAEHELLYGRRDDGDRGVTHLARNAAAQQTVLDKLGVSPDTDLQNSPPSLIGSVSRVKNNDLVEISLGADAGLQIGHQLSVSRNRVFLGRLIVRESYPERSVAEVVKEYRQGQILRGDRVATDTR